MRILLFSEVTLFKYNVSTILSPIVVSFEDGEICFKLFAIVHGVGDFNQFLLI